MSDPMNQTAQSIIEDTLALVHERVPADEVGPISSFLRRYYRDMPEDDLAETNPSDLYGAALAHRNFGARREPGTAKIRVYNPQPEQHGWQSGHTIIDVVTDDMPFLVDSLSMALEERGLPRHLVLHPILRVQRDDEGNLIDTIDDHASGGTVEAWMHFEVTRQAEREVLEEIRNQLQKTLSDVLIAVEDWAPMLGRLHKIVAELRRSPPPLPAAEIDDGVSFLEWLADNHFTLLGYREYDLVDDNGDTVLRSVQDSGLGLLRNRGSSHVSLSFANLTPERRRLARKRELLVIAKANSRSTIHRPGYLDSISIKRFDEEGRVIGEYRFLGLYTSGAYTRSVLEIPILRGKVSRLMAASRFPRGSHAAKALTHILETFPRDELFHIEEDDLAETATRILHLQDRARIRLFVHRERYGRYYSCLVFFPRDRYNTNARDATQKILENAFQATRIDFTVRLSESALARLHFVLRVDPGAEVQYDVEALEAQLQAATRSWRDDVSEAILGHFGEAVGTRLLRTYGDGFSAAYQETYTPQIAARDIEKIEAQAAARAPLAMTLYHPLEAKPNHVQLKLLHFGSPISLSDALPMLENMGLRVDQERPSRVDRKDAREVWIHDFEMTHQEGPDLDIDEVQSLFQEAFTRVWTKFVSNDGYNRLVLRAGLSWKEVVILRAYSKYLRQIGVTFSQSYMQKTVVANSEIARLLVELFHTRFHPDQNDSARAELLIAEIENALDRVQVLDQDRILRSFLVVIRATVRTNFYQSTSTGEPKPHLAFKFDPKEIPELPEPRPKHEVFVYSPRVEGVHLRGGDVARGGLRWSDRREDFRTEVLGLMKAQQVKNAVIVPVGSKGGFVPMKLPANRDQAWAEGQRCYQTFIRGLLDLTDNLVEGTVKPPPNVVRHDDDDPYLVVAADKGTATFSDLANAIALEYGFWLGDAFASGGSAGYDHKAIGITARGAWESVKRHFRRMGIDVQTAPFSVVGIGDMSGDVFGNGMLLSPHIRLIGAFNHRHIFLDPNPDPDRSFAERRRLFELPRSAWTDYDRSIISEGGGVFDRSAKSIPLSIPVQRALGVDQARMAPNDVIRAILKAPVDLLWNGGIGTYVKASSEHHLDVGDRANDVVRIDASELRCKVVGEGGNLGLTQRARIEYARQGGRLHTDAIDNSAGVDCSDHEVNIKILLNRVTEAQDLTKKQRDELLATMTDEVANLVLRNNYLQTQALSLAAVQTASMIDVQARLIERLEDRRAVDRLLEFLPDKVEIEDRKKAGQGLSLPELSVLMGYVKLTMYQDLLASDLPETGYFQKDLVDYFPTPLRLRHAALITEHQLAREIICTEVTNSVVNRAGSTFMFRLGEETGASPAEIARAFVAAREVFDQRRFWAEVEALDNRASADVQITMLLEGRKLVERAARWFLRNRAQPLDIQATIDAFAEGVAALRSVLTQHLPAQGRERIEVRMRRFVDDGGAPEDLASRVAGFTELLSALDIVQVANLRGASVLEVADVYYALGEELSLNWVRDQINALPRKDRWQTLGRDALRDDLYNQQRALTSNVLVGAPVDGSTSRVGTWLEANRSAAARCRRLLDDIRAKDRVDFTMLSVALRETRSLLSGANEVSTLPSNGGPESRTSGSGVIAQSSKVPPSPAN